MRIFKLIKSYPSLPIEYEVGSTVRKVEGLDKYKMYDKLDGSDGLCMREVENYPEYWEETIMEPSVYYFADKETFEPVDSYHQHYPILYEQRSCCKFETKEQRDDFVLKNRKQFSGSDMVSFAEYHHEEAMDTGYALIKWIENKIKQND